VTVAKVRTSMMPIAGAFVGLIVVVVIGLPILLTGAIASGDSDSPGLAVGTACVMTGPIAGLSDVSAQNARTIAVVAFARGGDRAALITLMIGLAESGLRELGNPNDPTAIGLPVDGIGTDHDSLGIFQQRPSWGTAGQRLDPVASTNLFLDRLLALPTLNTESPWRVAQTVQQSAYDGRPRRENHFSSEYGANYHATVAEAYRIVNLIVRDSARTHCDGTGGSEVGATPTGPTGAYGLPNSYEFPSDTSNAARTAVLTALSALGRPYVFGASGPNAFDCSGLMQWAWARAGVCLPQYTVDQWRLGFATDASHLLPGDLVLTPGADGTLSNPQHVGMSIGHGLIVEAPQTGDVVKVVTYASFVSEGLSGLTHIA
jgi:cell wall-associated NlpC family hydrolase